MIVKRKRKLEHTADRLDYGFAYDAATAEWNPRQYNRDDLQNIHDAFVREEAEDEAYYFAYFSISESDFFADATDPVFEATHACALSEGKSMS